jgi:hypothetical protein
MDVGKTITDGLGGVLSGIAGGPIGMIAGLLGGVMPDVLPSLLPHAAGPQGQAVADAVVSVVQAATGTANPTSANIVGLDAAGQADLRVKLATIAAQAEANRLTAEANQRASDLDTLRTELGDRANARAQTTELAKTGSAIAWAAPIVSVVVLATFGVLAYVIVTQQLPPGEAPLLIAGGMLTMAKDAIGYWLSSSASSRDKDQTIREAQTALANSTPVR